MGDEDVIYLEAGSTCYEIIPFLAECKDLTIIVNSLYLMTRLGAMVQHKIVLIGGGGKINYELRMIDYELVGDPALKVRVK